MNFIRKEYLPVVFFLWTFTCYADNEVRLVGGDGSFGRAEVFWRGTWKNIFTEYWSKLEGGVVCRQLDFPGVHSVTHDPLPENLNQPAELISKCEGYESSLLECTQYDIEDYQDSFHSYVQSFSNSIAHVTCSNQSTFPTADNVRLVDGDRYHGRVEVRLEGMWRRTCDELWTKHEGGVVCRQLGFRGVHSVNHNPARVNETTTTHSGRFRCDGYELSITDCVQYNLTSYSSNDMSVCNDTEVTCLVGKSVTVNTSTLSSLGFTWPTSKNIYEKQVGDELVLRCNATSATDIWWKHRTWSRTIPVTINNVLHLDNISLSDHGSYVCFARGSGGQTIESKPQVLILADYAHIILTMKSRYSEQISGGYWPDVVRKSVVKQFNNTAFIPVSVGNVNRTHFSLQVAQRLTTGVHYNNISNFESFVAGLSEYATNASRIHNADFWIQSLAFCIEESDDTSAGNLTFPNTLANSTAASNESCLTMSDLPRASRRCKGDFVSVATWTDAVVRNCFEDLQNNFAGNKADFVEQFLRTMEEENLSVSNVSPISHDLVDITSSEAIEKEDIDKIATILNKISNVNSSSSTVTKNVIEILDNVVTIATVDEGHALVPETSSVLLESLERQLETVRKSGSNFSDNRPNIAVEVVQIQNFDFPITFASLENENYKISETKLGQERTHLDQRRIQTSIQIPQYILQNFNSCILLDNANKTTFPVTFTIHRSQAFFNDPQATKKNLKQNSWVISASTLCAVPNLPSEYPVSTQFSPTKKRAHIDHDEKCVFWDHNLRGKGKGGWSSKGCFKRRKEGVELYECLCSHLPKFANFAVLIDVKGSINSLALYILTVIGCVASICSLLITIVSYLYIKKLRTSQPKRIILNLCVALLGLYCCFLIGINRTELDTVCIIFGGLIHFFCLSSMAWMSVEATQLYLLLVKVLNAQVKNFLMKATLIAWGFPFVVVVICVAVTKDNYSHEYCFPKSTSFVFYIGVLGLVGLLIAYNIVIYFTIIWNLTATRRNIARSQTNRTGVVRRLQNAFAISVLLGLTWCFGFLAIGSLRITFNVLFCLFNSFQGVFIFLLFCLRQEEVKAAWRKWFGIKKSQKKREGDAFASQNNFISTAKGVTTEDETPNKAVTETTVELTKADDSHGNTQITTISTSQDKLQDTTL